MGSDLQFEHISLIEYISNNLRRAQTLLEGLSNAVFSRNLL